MPRKPKTGRQFQSAGHQSAEDRIRQRYSNRFAFFGLHRENFNAELPSPEERQAFVNVFRDRFLGMFDCVLDPDNDGEDYYLHAGPQVFQRSDAFWQRRREIAFTGFDAPELETITGTRWWERREAAIAAARARWFRENGLRITTAERAWLRGHEASTKQAAPRTAEVSRVIAIETR
jgi:hypothetical protein